MARKAIMPLKMSHKRRTLLPGKRQIIDPVGILSVPSDGLSEESKTALREYRQHLTAGIPDRHS